MNPLQLDPKFYLKTPPAIVQQAIKPFHQLVQAAAQAFSTATKAEDTWLIFHEELHARYREQFKTWDECCQSVYGCSRQAVTQKLQRLQDRLALLSENEYKKILKNSDVSPSTPPLTKLAEEADSRALKAVETARAKPITADEWEAKEAYSVITDETGFPVPPTAKPYWERRQEIQDLMTQISRIKGAIEDPEKEKDLLFMKIPQGVAQALGSIYQSFSFVKPYAVCTSCDGKRPQSCHFCKGTGLISKHEFDHMADKKKVEARKK